MNLLRLGLWIGTALLATGVAAQPPTTANAGPQVLVTIKDVQGKSVGTARLHDSAKGVLMQVEITALPEGTHAFHIHETGKCEPPFQSAGAHFNPGSHKHGFANKDGAHAGDLPNIHVPKSGQVTVEVMARDVQLREGPSKLMDADGAALVIHAAADDHQTDPAGGAGDRIACGVIEAAK